MKTIKQISFISLLGFLFIAILVGYQYFRQNNSSEILNNTPTPSPSTTTTITSQAPTNKPDPLAGHCLVQISGHVYDVTVLKTTHSGGDIFQCGTDMTSIYFTQHTESHLNNQMTKYRVN